MLRFLTREPPELAERALGVMRRVAAGEVAAVVTEAVLAEVVWTLRKSYGYSREQVTAALGALLTSPGVESDPHVDFSQALALYASSGLSLGDALIAARAAATGLPVATFDEDLARASGVTLWRS